MWKVNVSPLAQAHLHAGPLTTLHFTQQPTVRDVLQRIGQHPAGIKVLFWGEDVMGLDDAVADESLLCITNAAAEEESRRREEEDMKMREARSQAGEAADQLWQALQGEGQTLLRTMVFLPEAS